MRKNIKIIIVTFLALVLIVGCAKKEASWMDKLKNKLNSVAEEVFINDEWTKGGIKENVYTLSLKELADHNKLKLEDYKNPETGKLCDSEKSNIKFIVKKETQPNKTNYELKINLICD